MCFRWSLVVLMLCLSLVACEQQELPPGVLEFEVPAGKFRVVTPQDWVETPELGGYTAVESADLDLVFGVIAINPGAEHTRRLGEPRLYSMNAREIAVYDGLPGSRSIYYGIEFDSENVLHGIVSTTDRSYYVVMIRSVTVKILDTHEQTFVDIAVSLEEVPLNDE